MSATGGADYDVFLSFSGADRGYCRRLAGAMREAGLRVFLDEDDVPLFTGINSSIERALSTSRVFVAYYSTSYAQRPACQLELTAAFIAAQRHGADPRSRILVVNPEPTTDHLLPAELSDARFATKPDCAESFARFARAVRAKVEQSPGCFGELAPQTDRPWFARRTPGNVTFVGRNRLLWQLHTALHAADLPLSQEPKCGPVVSLAGLPGSGRSALLAAYAWHFWAAFDGGIFWLSLAGTRTTAQALDRYAGEMREIAVSLGLRVDGQSRRRIAMLVYDHLARQNASALWIVDDIPDGFDPAADYLLTPPPSTRARTVLVSDGLAFEGCLPVLEVGPLSPDDARGLIERYRVPEDGAESKAFEELVHRSGGHAGTLASAGSRLRDQQGLRSFDDVEIETTALRRVLRRLTPTAVLVLQLASVCGRDDLPVELIHDVVSAVGGGSDAGHALVELRRHLLAHRVGTTWIMHPLAVRGAREQLHRVVPDQRLAQAVDVVRLRAPAVGSAVGVG